MKMNTEKSYLLLSANNNLTANIVESKKNQALPGIIIDTNFFFNKTINNLYKKATAKASCSCQDFGLHKSPKMWDNSEIIFNISAWLLSIDMDVP